LYDGITHSKGEESDQGNMDEQTLQVFSAEAEGGRRPTEGSAAQAVEVEAPMPRRRLTVAYKIRIVETMKAVKAEGGGSIGAFLRKEGLYYSTVRKWAEQYDRGALTRRQDESKTQTKALRAENERLRRKLEQTERKLKKTEAIVEIQKKLSAILGLDQAPKSGSDDEH
jgi:transposase